MKTLIDHLPSQAQDKHIGKQLDKRATRSAANKAPTPTAAADTAVAAAAPAAAPAPAAAAATHDVYTHVCLQVCPVFFSISTNRRNMIILPRQDRGEHKDNQIM